MIETIISLLEALIFPGIVFAIILAFLFDWLERKTMARMVGRVGPLVTGPSGIFQPLADFSKLLFKEEIIPEYADQTIFKYAPGLYFLIPLIGLLFVPVISTNAIAGFPYDLLFVIFLFAYSTFVISVLGYSSASGYTTIASGRLVLQYVSYEIPLIIAILTPALFNSTLSISNIVSAQSLFWNVFFMPISIIVFLIALLAELEKPPFDIPSAKTEIVAGWLTEFSGHGLGFLKLGKQLGLVFGLALATALFLGGPLGPGTDTFPLLYVAYFLVKLLALGLVIFIVRTALARLRIGDATVLFWRILIPLSLLQLGLIILWRP